MTRYHEDSHALAAGLNALLREVRRVDDRHLTIVAVLHCEDVAERLNIPEVEPEPSDHADEIHERRHHELSDK